MKRIILAASALSLLAAPAAFAQNATVGVNASVENKCSAVGLASQTISLGQLPLDANGFLAGSGDFDNIPGANLNALTSNKDVWCNTAANITIAGTPLVHSSLDQFDRGRGYTDGFTRHIDMRIAGFSYGGVSFSDPEALNSGSGLDNATGSQTVNSNGAFVGKVNGTAQIWSGPAVYGQPKMRPLGGTYRAQWTITVAPGS